VRWCSCVEQHVGEPYWPLTGQTVVVPYMYEINRIKHFPQHNRSVRQIYVNL